MKQTWICALLMTLSFALSADDGMWMPHQMKDLNLQTQGLQMNPADLYKADGTGLMSAVVHLGGGTGEFISANGLILTNHHVAFGALQRAADKDHDYITDGFLAQSRAEEIPAPGYVADVLLRYEEITREVYGGLKKNLKPYDKHQQLEAIQKAIIKKAESKGKDLYCTIRSMYNGNQYYLYTFKRLKDVRLVYAPPLSIGNFGGEVDNWMWPRHTCDFTYLRAYVSKDNLGTDYAPDNVPYQPKSFLTISLEGVKTGDFSFIMGYPGRTYRSYTAAQFEDSIEELGKRLDQLRDTIAFFEKAGQNDRAIQIKYAGLIKGLNNGLKNATGKLEGFSNRRIADLKRQQEEAFIAGIENETTRQKARRLLDDIADYVTRTKQFSERYQLVNSLKSPRSGSALLAQAYTLYKGATQLQKADNKREPGFQDRDLPQLMQRIKLAERSYDFNTDKAYFKHILGQNLDKTDLILPPSLKDALAAGQEGIDKLVDEAYGATILADAPRRLTLLKQKPAELLKTGDILIKIASELEDISRKFEKTSKAMDQEFSDLRQAYLAIVLQEQKLMAPDANSTIRFTSGIIDGYFPKDAVFYGPKTSLRGVMEKEQADYPFAVPQKLKELHARKDFGPYMDAELKDISTCFLNTTNVTGGNSGSPTFNARGEQTGIIFDMTYESVTGDYHIIPELQRTISVDIRYVLFITEKFSGAGYLLNEMTIKK